MLGIGHKQAWSVGDFMILNVLLMDAEPSPLLFIMLDTKMS